MLEMWLQKQDYCVTAVYSSMSVEDQDMCINIFNQDLPLPGDETDASPGILISTLEILDIDYTCVCAFQLILLSSSWLERNEIQSKAHICCYRQMNKAMYIYCLYEAQHGCMTVKFKKKHPRTMQHFCQDA
ncbi:hypothetical protein CIHG_10541 [Coccidioides immitis H538.4]|uniref:Uncharacterized protein n=1 Tax=Coccidioides immitis H538.4 TaxID=396776 RepID=A0A0J8S780_COCIT|nr:hypothetical protein CIHG_10541 [Coccidioides immitis H538.4]